MYHRSVEYMQRIWLHHTSHCNCMTAMKLATKLHCPTLPPNHPATLVHALEFDCGCVYTPELSRMCWDQTPGNPVTEELHFVLSGQRLPTTATMSDGGWGGGEKWVRDGGREGEREGGENKSGCGQFSTHTHSLVQCSLAPKPWLSLIRLPVATPYHSYTVQHGKRSMLTSYLAHKTSHFRRYIHTTAMTASALVTSLELSNLLQTQKINKRRYNNVRYYYQHLGVQGALMIVLDPSGGVCSYYVSFLISTLKFVQLPQLC